jgi:hypothetical protein
LIFFSISFKIESGGFGKTVRHWTIIGRARVLITVTYNVCKISILIFVSLIELFL